MLTPSNPHLPFPHSSQVRGELRELRCHYGSELYRVLYRRSRKLVVLLHMFRKDKGKIPKREIQIAEERWEDFKTRMDAERRGLRVRPAVTRLDEFINIDKLRNMSPRKSNVHPVGTPVSETRRSRMRRSAEYRAAQERLAPYEAIARFVIQRRAELGLTQQQLAERMGTSHSAISRIESGQHPTSVTTLQRLAEALEARFVFGFESGPPERPVRELVSG